MEDDEYSRSSVLRQHSTVPGLVSVPSGSLPDELIRRLSVYDPVSTSWRSPYPILLHCGRQSGAGCEI
jgi:hypothetical protein